LWSAPLSPLAGGDRAARLRRDLLGPGALEVDTPDARLQTFLEAVRPSLGAAPLGAAEREALLEQANFQAPALRSVVRGLLRLGAHTADPLARLRASRTPFCPGPASLEAQ